jgi:superfamily II DNA/RNA helicase
MSLLSAEKQLTFRELGLAAPLIKALDLQGIGSPFPIQAATIPDAIAGHDILGRGQTGSGKTLAFGLAMLHNLIGVKAKPRKPIALVLAPTRELAQQIDEVITPLAKVIGHESIVIAGGMPYGKQVNALKKGVSILISTPGRLIDLLEKKELTLDQLQIVVLDEADQMADMGFLPVVKQILNQAKKDGQRFLFSATLDKGVDGLVRNYLREPKTHTVKEIEGMKAKSDHYVFVLDIADKSEISNRIAARDGKSIFFVRTKRGADRLASKFSNAGVRVGTLHGGKSQSVRTRTLAQFKAEDSAVLVATDVAARGIHVDGIDLVVHFDAPADHKDYLHRSGRTARAGKTGRVVTLATHKEQRAIGGITTRAGVEPWVMAMKPLDEKLVTITGAKEPSGVPLVEKVQVPTKNPYHKKRNQGRNKRRRNGYEDARFKKSDRQRKRSKSA